MIAAISWHAYVGFWLGVLIVVLVVRDYIGHRRNRRLSRRRTGGRK